MEFQALPEGCVASILSCTTPADVCRLSAVSKIFCSAAESDEVWERFLPSDYHSIVSQASAPLNYDSKKALYFALADRPVIIDQGRKSFQLEKKSGKKCYMLAARALTVIWGDNENYWTWIVDPNSRFPEIAELKDVCWLEIRGVINTRALSPNTQYAAYLVFKMIDAYGFRNRPVELSVEILGGHVSSKIVCLDSNRETPSNRVMGLQRPKDRNDGWLEIEMGEFFNPGLEDEVKMSVLETTNGNWKKGLFLEGIEVRPKREN
ncbi:F-box protein PP2-B10 [Cajanus cajan]|uniref:F-box protein PP2-B10 n=1 Tax=Cajanus cajan TaxID=3821 RepID=A0A151U5P2_CAJCA|nr:F-box protein PP2-B10 [Cajanus cajan]KYP74578.1 F-box protein PP2-B10 [Cajanus cajan]